jgi:hypothetical protein
MVRVEGPLVQELREIAEGRSPWPPTQARRHHFVPAFLLARFATPGRQRKGFIFQLDTKSGKPQRTTPNDTAFGDELYAQDTDDGPDRTIEAFLSVVEKHGARALQRLVDDPYGLSYEDRQTISYLLAFQHSRTPVGLKLIMENAGAMRDIALRIDFGNADAFRRWYRDLVDGEADDDEIEARRERMLKQLERGEAPLRPLKTEAFRLLLTTADDIAQVVNGLAWTICVANGGELVSSDRALAMHDPTPKAPWSGNAWLSSPNAETTVPLDPNHCLFLHPGETSISSVEIDANAVREINLRTYGWADRYIYGRTQEMVTTVRRQAKRMPHLVIKPRIARPVILEDARPDHPSAGIANAKRGWPNRLWIDDGEGPPRYADYTVIDPNDPDTIEAALANDPVGHKVL